MKRSKEEILAMLNDNAEGLGDNLIGLLEDVSDSMEDVEIPDMSQYVAKSEYDTLVGERDELKAKYIARFMGGSDNGEVIVPDPKTPDPEEIKEATIEEILKEYE